MSEAERQEPRLEPEREGLVRDLTEGKLATRLDLIRAEALVSETQGLIPPLQAAAQIRSNEIAKTACGYPITYGDAKTLSEKILHLFEMPAAEREQMWCANLVI